MLDRHSAHAYQAGQDVPVRTARIVRNGAQETPSARGRLKRVLHRLDELARDGVFVVQFGLALIVLHFAVVLMFPGSTFDTGKGFRWFQSIASENTWARIYLVASAICLPGLFSRRCWMKVLSAFVSAFVFGVVSFGFAAGNMLGTGWGTYMIMLGWSYWVLWMRLRGRR